MHLKKIEQKKRFYFCLLKILFLLTKDFIFDDSGFYCILEISNFNEFLLYFLSNIFDIVHKCGVSIEYCRVADDKMNQKETNKPVTFKLLGSLI